MKKECTTCNKRKPLGEFYNQTKGKYGLRSSCKECEKVYHKIYYRSKHPLQPKQKHFWRPEKGQQFDAYGSFDGKKKNDSIYSKKHHKHPASPFICIHNENNYILAKSQDGNEYELYTNLFYFTKSPPAQRHRGRVGNYYCSISSPVYIFTSL